MSDHSKIFLSCGRAFLDAVESLWPDRNSAPKRGGVLLPPVRTALLSAGSAWWREWLKGRSWNEASWWTRKPKGGLSWRIFAGDKTARGGIGV